MMSSAQPPILLHEGNQSRIYYQPESEYKRPVVIKVLKASLPPARELIQLNNEYEFTKDLAIKGVRNSISRTRIEEKPALVLEYIAGQSIKQAFVEHRQSLIDFLKVGIQIAQTLGELHMQHIIHRDINSSNILVNLKTHTVKVIDFGLASRLDLQIEHLGNPEGLAYTLAYISPEQTGRMNRMVDFRTDLYSLGVSFYEMLSGRLPFISDDPLALVHAHMAMAPQSLSAYDRDIPPIISDIVMRLLAKNAEDRYQSAFGLKADLERCLGYLQNPKTRKKPEGLSFKLGSDDYSGRLHIPQKLYGRSTEIATLMAAFDRAASGGRELMLVAGYAGVGKTALVAEVHKPITEKRGYFISGKFDQYQRNTPYTALSHAFNQFAELLLTESEKSLTRWRETILSAVGGNGAVLTELMPGLEKVIGVQPEVAALSGNENRNRFNLSFQNFVQAIGTAEHPLVVFIDDCQWADLASLELLRVLLSNEKTGYVLLICAYRDNEVDQAHPLMTIFKELIGSGLAIKTIGLGNLGKADVRRLLQESLTATDADSLALTELVYEKTRGNAFFTRQLLQNLYEENWLRFDFTAHRWAWDIVQLKGRRITDNVVDLMSVRLKKLSPETAGLLQLAACIGSEFDLETLSLISQESIPGTLEMLIEAINQGLVIPQDDYYQLSETATQAHFHFLHDRVQQAAYAQISSKERQNVHLKIGRRLLADIPANELEKRVFDVLNHYNQALSLITNKTEQLRVVGLNITAAESAFRAAAFQSAKVYLETALPLMPADAWAGRYETMLKLHSLLATALSLIGDTERLEEVYHITEDRARTMADTATVKMARIQSLLFHGNYADAIEIGLEFVQGMGVPINRNPSPEESIRYLQETADWLTPSRIETLNRLPDAPPDTALVMEVALVINGATFNSDISFHLYFVSQIARLCIEKGLSPWAPVTLMTFTADLSAALHDIPKARMLAEKILQLFEERYRADNPVAPLSLLMGGFIAHRYEHLKHTLPIFVEGVQKGLLTGSFQFGGYCAWWQAWHQLFLGEPLSRAEEASIQAEETCRKMQLGRMVDWCFLIHQVVLNLQGRSDAPWILKGDVYDENEKLALAFKLNDLADVFRIYFYKGWLHFLFGRQEEAVEYFRKSESYSLYGSGHYILPLFYLYDTLANAALFDQAPPDGRAEILERITRNIKEIEIWARFAPMNYQHQKDLMEAEKARIEGRFSDAEESYDKAIQDARENEFYHIEALACERASEFHLSQGKEDASRLHMIRAHECYSRWQAWAKVRDLERRHPQWFIRPEPVSMKESAAEQQVELRSLDLRSVMKATQAISGEIVLEELLRKLMEIVIENAGAQRGCLILEKDGKWLIEAEGAANQREMRILQGIDLEASDELSRSIVRFVARSHEGVVLDDAAHEGLFVDDPYIKHNRIKSVLCTPLLNRGRLNGILYLENNLTTDAFTSENIEVLEMLAGQAAIALENAALYQQSQQEIAERRQAEEALRESRELLVESNRELESTNEELQAAMEELEATNDALLESGNELAATNQRLAESEAKFRTIIENMQDAFYRSSLDGKLIMASPSFARFFGFDTLEECLGRNIAQTFYVDPDDRKKIIELVKSHGRITDYEVRLRHRDGNIIYATASSQFFYDRDGTVAGIEGVLRDITRRKKAEAEREAALEALRQANIVVENSPAILLRWKADEGWPIELVSKNISQFGYSAEDLMSGATTYASLIHPEDLDRVADELREHSEGGIESFQQVYRIITRNGEARWVEDRSIMERDTVGHVTFYQGIVIDITERKRAEEELRESEARFRRLAENAPDMIFRMTLPEGRYEYVSPASRQICGYDPEEICQLPQLIKQLIHPDWVAYFTEEWSKLIAGHAPPTYEYQIINKSGQIKWLRQRNVLIYDDKVQPVALEGIVSDITEHKQAEESLRESEERFRLFMEHFPGLAYMKDSDGRTLFANEGFKTLLNIPTSDILGKSNYDLFPPEFSEKITNDDRALLESGESREIEEQFAERTWSTYKFVLPQSDGPPLLGGLTLDITERRKAEDAMLREKAFSDTVINSLPVTFFLFNDRGELVRWNNSFLEQSGYSEEELKGISMLNFIPEENHTSVTGILKKAYSEGHADFETYALKKGGAQTPYHFSISRLLVDGKPYILGAGIDITGQKLSQEALLREKAFSDTVINSLPTSFFLFNDQGELIRWNESHREQSGYSDEELKGMHITGFFPETYRESVLRNMHKVIEEGHGEFETLTLCRDGKKKPYHFSISRMTVEGKPYILGSGLDITERKLAQAQLERNLRETVLRLEVSQALATTETEDDVLDVLIRQALIFPDAHVTLFTFDRTGDELVSVLRRQDHSDKKHKSPLTVGMHLSSSHFPFLKLYRSDQPFISNDIWKDERFDSATRGLFEKMTTTSHAVFPLTAGKDWMGVIGATSHLAGYFDEEKQHLYRTLAELGAAALHAARLRQTIREAEQRLNDIFQGSPIPAFIIDSQHLVIHWNRALEEISGIKSEEVMGSNAHWRAFYDQERPCMADLLMDGKADTVDSWYQGKYRKSDLLEGAYEATDFFPNLGKDGRWLRFTAAVIRDPSGRPLGALETLEDITERKLAEAEVLAQREQLQIIAANVPGVVYQFYALLTGEYGMSFVSERTMEVFELDNNTDTFFAQFAERVHPDDLDAFMVSIREAVAAVRPWRYEGRFVKRSGDILWFSGGSNPIRLPDRIVFNGFLLDITERKRAEEALRLTQFAMDQAADSILWVDDEGMLIYANQSACDSMGYTREEFARMKVFELDPDFPESDWEQHKSDLKRLGRMSFEGRHRKKGGELFPVEVTTYYIDHKGRFLGIAFDRDITERKRAEEALRESEEKYRNLVDNMQDVVFQCDLGGRIIYTTPSSARLLGCPSAESMIGMNVADFHYFPEEAEKQGRILAEQGFLKQYEVTLKRMDNGKPVIISNSAQYFRDREGNIAGIEGVYFDITARKEAEEARALNAERTQALLHLNQMTEANLKAITDFALEEAVSLTRSTMGYLAFLNEDESELTMHSWSRSAMTECAVTDKPIIYPLKTTGLWGEAVRQRRPVITNDYTADNPWKKGCPEGHVAVKRHMNIPVFAGSKIVAVAGVGNKSEEYDQDDVQQLTLLMEGMWRLIERKRAEEALIRSEALLRSIFEASPAGIALLENRRFQKVNYSLCRITGYSEEEMLGQNSSFLYIDGEEYTRIGAMYAATESYGFATSDAHFRRKDGTVINALVSLSPANPNDPKGSFIATVLDITDLKRAEESLRESEATLRSVFLAAPVGIGILKNRVQTSVNKYWCDRFGYTEEEIIGNSTRMLYESDEEFNRAGQELYDDLREKGIASAETRMIAKDGSTHNVLLTTALIRQDDISAGVIGIIYDITERKRMEDALREKTEELERYFTNALDLLCIADLDGHFRKLNKEWEKLLGYSIQELEGRRFLDFVHPDDLSATLDAVSELESQNQVLSFVNRYRAKDESYRWLEWRSTPVGNLIYAVARDITERIQAEDALRESEERFRAIFNSVNDSLFVHDPDTGDILDVNQVMCDKFGYTRVEALQKNVGQLSSGESMYTQQDALMWIKKALEEGPQLIEWEAKDSSGRLFWMEGNMRRAVIGGHDRIIMAARDITERKRLEEALEKRILALTRPLDSAGEVAFEDLFNLDEIQRLQDLFSATFGVAGLITRPDGAPITKPSNFGRLCAEFIRNNPKGMANCMHSDAMIGETNPSGPNIGTCLSAGLCNAGASITIGGRHIANWLIGQVRNETQNEEEVMAYGRELGADEDEFRRAYREVPVMSQEQFESLAHLLFAMATQLSASAYQNVQQARFIAELKKAEEALKESADRYRMLVSTSMDGFVVVDKCGLLVDANEAYCKATGYSRDELIGMAIVDLDAKDDPDAVMERTARIINKGSELFETQHRRKDGTAIDVEVNITLIPATGQMLAFLRDITERKRAEVALRESEWRYRLLSDYYHHLNSIFISFAEARSMEDLYRIISDLYRQFTGAGGVALLQYNYDDSSFTVASLSGDERQIAAAEEAIGTGLLDLHIPVGDELKDIMINEVIKRSDSLSTVTTGAIPQEVSDRILEALGCQEVICLAIYHGAELVGTVNAFMRDKDASLPLDTLRTFGQMAGLSIIRKRTEEEIIRLNTELEQKVSQRTRELKGAYDELVKEVEERKAAEEALRQSKNHLNLITNNMLDLVSIIGRDYTFTYVSPSHKTVLGYDPDEYLGKSVLDFVSHNDREKTAAVIDSILSTGLTGSTLNRFRNADGHLQWVETFGSVLHDDAGEAIGVITSGRDITDRYLLERQLKLSERRFRGLFENSPVSLFELDLSKPKSYLDELRASGMDDLETYLEGKPEAIERCIMLTRLINVNSTAREIFEIERRGIILEEYPNIIRQCIDTFRECLIILSQGSRSFGEEITIEVGSERTMHLSFRISLAPGAEENWSRAIASVEDITSFKEMERDLKLARDSAEKANRAKSEFLANMSHELRTPLNAIIGFSQIIDMQLQEKSIEKLTEYLGYIKTSGEHLLDMVNDILDLSKIEAGKIELDIKQFNLRDTLISIPTHVKSLAMKKGLIMQLDIASDLGIIRGDEVRIKQIIYNLLSNAIKFTESGKHIGISARREGTTAVITVWDEGIGIDAQNIARIFQPFEQVGVISKDTQGTGLGLAITMRLVQLHGGGIKVESSPGGGSKFTITLPGAFAVDGELEKREPAPGRPHTKALGRSRRILVVDDNKTNLRLLEEFLKTVGFEVETMRSGEEAVDRLAHADFDLILMDIKMPGIGGIEAMKAIRAMNRHNLKIFAFTASAMKGSEESLLKMGFDDYISKPVDLSGLLTRIKKSLDDE